jgi:hypothetical protein
LIASLNAAAEQRELTYTQVANYKNTVLAAIKNQQIQSDNCLSYTFGGWYLETLVNYSRRAFVKNNNLPQQVTFEFSMIRSGNGYRSGSYIIESTFNISNKVEAKKIELLTWDGIQGTDDGPKDVWKSSKIRICE